DSLDQAIRLVAGMPDIDDPHVQAMVMVFTDGEEYRSKLSFNDIKPLVQKYEAKENWSFVGRIDASAAGAMRSLGFPADNLHVWGRTEQDLARSTSMHTSGYVAFASNTKLGATRKTTS